MAPQDADAPLQPFTMFSMTIVAAPAALVGIIYLSFAAPLAFQARRSTVNDAEGSPAAEGDGEADNTGDGVPEAAPPALSSGPRAMSEPVAQSNRRSDLFVRSETLSDGTSLSHAQSGRFGSNGSPRYLLEALVTPSCSLLLGRSASMLGQLVAPTCDARLLIRGGVVYPARRHGLLQDLLVEAEDRLLIACLADGAAALMRVDGLQLRPDQPGTDKAMGSSLVLVEAAVAFGSPLIDVRLGDARESLLRGADVWSMRQRRRDARGPSAGAALSARAIRSGAAEQSSHGGRQAKRHTGTLSEGEWGKGRVWVGGTWVRVCCAWAVLRG